jgi:hypothetical protein
VNGDRPRHSRPAFISFTFRRTTSETGSLDFSSSRNEGANRIGIFSFDRPHYK